MTEKEYNDLLSKRIGLKDQFEFKCNCCGKCCEHRDDIVLSAIDLYNIANYFHREIDEIIKRYCNINVRNYLNLPIITLKPIGPKDACPFLRNRKCSIHSVKPTVCALFPLGRININKDSSQEVGFFFIDPGCGKKGIFQTVEDWVSDEIMREEKKFWDTLLRELSKTVNDILEKNSNEQAIKSLYAILFFELYLNYSLELDIFEQLEKKANNIEHINTMLHHLFLGEV